MVFIGDESIGAQREDLSEALRHGFLGEEVRERCDAYRKESGLVLQLFLVSC